MRNKTALLIATTGLQEIRVLLRQGNTEQALEAAVALDNLPINETNTIQDMHTERAIEGYLSKYPDRKLLPHWRDLLKATGILGAQNSVIKEVGKPFSVQSSTA